MPACGAPAQASRDSLSAAPASTWQPYRQSSAPEKGVPRHVFISLKSFRRSPIRQRIIYIANIENKLTDLCGNWILQNDLINTSFESFSRLTLHRSSIAMATWSLFFCACNWAYRWFSGPEKRLIGDSPGLKRAYRWFSTLKRGLSVIIRAWKEGFERHVYLTECVHAVVLESQPPHKAVNLISQLVIVNNMLIIWWGSWLS